VKAVYIRQTGGIKKEKVTKVLENLETLDISVCYFKNSAQVISHLKKAGLIS
jgi:hypothetical protein